MDNTVGLKGLCGEQMNGFIVYKSGIPELEEND